MYFVNLFKSFQDTFIFNIDKSFERVYCAAVHVIKFLQQQRTIVYPWIVHNYLKPQGAAATKSMDAQQLARLSIFRVTFRIVIEPISYSFTTL